MNLKNKNIEKIMRLSEALKEEEEIKTMFVAIMSSIEDAFWRGKLSPDGTTVLDEAFCGCKNLTRIDIPARVTTIGDFAFRGCENLKILNIPGSVTTIRDFAFYGCKNLKILNITNGVTTIGKFAFYGCKNLKILNITNGVTTIGKYAFRGCENLKWVISYHRFENIPCQNYLPCFFNKNVQLPVEAKNKMYYFILSLMRFDIIPEMIKLIYSFVKLIDLM